MGKIKHIGYGVTVTIKAKRDKRYKFKQGDLVALRASTRKIYPLRKTRDIKKDEMIMGIYNGRSK